MKLTLHDQIRIRDFVCSVKAFIQHAHPFPTTSAIISARYYITFSLISSTIDSIIQNLIITTQKPRLL